MKGRRKERGGNSTHNHIACKQVRLKMCGGRRDVKLIIYWENEKIKTTMEYCFIPTRMAKIEKLSQVIVSVGKDVE